MNILDNLKKINLKAVCVFLIGLALVFQLCGMIISPKGYSANDIVGTTSVLNRLKKEKDNSFDVLFAGDSCMTYGISPLQIWGDYGYKTYNLSYQAAKICDTYAVIQEVLKTQKPKVIVLDCDSLFLDGRVYQTEDQILNSVEQVFSVFHYHTVYKLMAPSVSFIGKKVYSDQLFKGFRIKSGTVAYTGGKYMKDNSDGSHRNHDKAEEMGTDSESYLNAIYKLCTDNNIQMLLVNVPAPNLWNQEKHETVQSWADQYHIDYVDMNLADDQIGLDWNTDTADGGGHLNLSGSKKVTAYLAKYLQNKYSLSVDAENEEWKAAYNRAAVYGEKS